MCRRQFGRSWFPLWVIFGLLVLIPGRVGHAQDIQQLIDQRLKSLPAGCQAAVVFENLTTGRRMGQHRADAQMIPASNMKLVTTAAAASVLGSDFKFTTSLIQHDRDLIILGDGDPGFGDAEILAEQLSVPKSERDKHGIYIEKFLNQWVEAVEAEIDRQVESELSSLKARASSSGRPWTDQQTAVRRTVLKEQLSQFDRLIYDDRVFDRQFVNPDWPEDQLQYYYCAQVAGINFNTNVVDLYARPTDPLIIGDSPMIDTVPVNAPINLTITTRMGNRNAFWATRVFGTNRITARGIVDRKLTHPIYITIHDPSQYFAQLLADRLETRQIMVGQVERASPEWTMPGTPAVVIRQANHLSRVLQRCNEDSQNLYAECLVKRMGRKATGRPGSWSTGNAVVRSFLAHPEVLGPTAAQFELSDGSGLSRNNRLTPEGLVRLLGHMYDNDQYGSMYLKSLSVGPNRAGVPVRGQMRRRFRHQPLTGVLLGKSGYIREVLALSGYLIYDVPVDPKQPAGKVERHVVGFSMILNGYDQPVYQGKQWLDRLLQDVDQVLSGQYHYRAPTGSIYPSTQPATAPQSDDTEAGIDVFWSNIRMSVEG